MPRRRSGRFVLEALFLAGVAAAVTVAQLRPAVIVGSMALAWVVVALIEWAAWLDEPHYGRGLPPRYSVPRVALPPPRAVEQPGHYPASHYPALPEYPVLDPDDEPTFVASVTEWAAAIEDWAASGAQQVEEETQIALPGEQLGDGSLGERELDFDETAFFPGPSADPEPPVEPLFPTEILLQDELEPEPVDEEPLAPPEPEPAVAPALPPVPTPAPEPARVELPPVARPATMALHHVDPLVPTGRRRLFRRAVEETLVEVPDGPPEGRRLPDRDSDPGAVGAKR